MDKKEYDSKIAKNGIWGRPSSDGDLKMKDLSTVKPDDRFSMLELDIDGVPDIRVKPPKSTSTPVSPPQQPRATQARQAPPTQPSRIIQTPAARALQTDLESALGATPASQSRLIHGVFNPASFLYQFWSEQLAARNRSLSTLTWRTPQHHPEYTTDPHVAVVLSPFLGTIQETFDWYTAIVYSQNVNIFAVQPHRSGIKNMRMWNGVRFEPNTIGWHRIKLNANYTEAPKIVRKKINDLPGLEVLAALAGHSERARKMGNTRGYTHVRMAGLEALTADYSPCFSVPHSWFLCSDRRKLMDAADPSQESTYLSVPVFVGNI